MMAEAATDLVGPDRPQRLPGSGSLAAWTVLTAALLWWLLINQLRLEWSNSAQYAYGWAVPVLALYLFLERWKCRPAAVAYRTRAVVCAAVALLASLLPIRLIQEANPDWRLISWLLAFSVTALSVLYVLSVGGISWLWHFAFPVCFILVAVPWPVPIEHRIIQSLMSNVASLCVETLGWMGIATTQHGNVIQTAAGPVGVEEACSGVRSLQTSIMAALFLGELFRFSIPRRAVLLIGGLGIAYGCNFIRTLLLVWLQAGHGEQAIVRWHDTIGISVLVVTFLLLGALAAWLRAQKASTSEGLSAGKVKLLPTRVLVTVAAWLVISELCTQAWYKMHEQPSATFDAWTLRWPLPAADFHEAALPKETQEILRCDESRTGRWSDADGRRWTIIYLRWFPGRAASMLARTHVPEVCMSAAGSTLQADLGMKNIAVRALTLPVRSYVFDDRGQRLYVFYSLIEEGTPPPTEARKYRSLNKSARWEAVANGVRNRGQRVMEVAIAGVDDYPAAEAAFRDALPAMIAN